MDKITLPIIDELVDLPDNYCKLLIRLVFNAIIVIDMLILSVLGEKVRIENKVQKVFIGIAVNKGAVQHDDLLHRHVISVIFDYPIKHNR